MGPSCSSLQVSLHICWAIQGYLLGQPSQEACRPCSTLRSLASQLQTLLLLQLCLVLPTRSMLHNWPLQ
jgi:hypothetical protein